MSKRHQNNQNISVSFLSRTDKKLISLLYIKPKFENPRWRRPPSWKIEKSPYLVRGFWATVCKTVRPMLSVRCLSVLSVCNLGVLWPNSWTDQDETWHAGRPRPWPHCVRWGPSPPPLKGHSPSNFRPISVAAKWLHGSRSHLVCR